MAQAATGLSWHTSTHEPNPVLSEKPIDNDQPDLRVKTRPTENAIQGSQSNVTRVGSASQKFGSKSRKRGLSVKAAQPVIPQTREELDERLSYAPSRHFNVRTIPPWVRDALEDDIVDDIEDDDLHRPDAALIAQHNTNPSNTSRPGRQARVKRSNLYPTSSGALREDRSSRWVSFARSSAYPRENFDCEKVDAAWLNENFTDYSRGWLEGQDDPENDGGSYGAFRRKRQVWHKRARFTILRNPFVPLAFRFTVILFAAMAMGLGASIYHETGDIQACRAQPNGQRDAYCAGLIGQDQLIYYRDPSGLMAVIIDVVAIIYTLYITYDEYFSKPLGLRKARAKVRLVLLDLFFIVFQSANLSLAFEALTVDQGACAVGSSPATSYKFGKICDRARALSAVLLVSLVAWLLTFAVSVLRIVERINTR